MAINNFKEWLGRWLVFGPRTLFGDSKQHFGIVVCGNDNTGLAISVSSQVEGRVLEWERKRYPEETLILLEPGSPMTGLHFKKPSIIDCNSACCVGLDEFNAWMRAGDVKSAGFNEIVDAGLMERIIVGIRHSPRVLPRLKKLLPDEYL